MWGATHLSPLGVLAEGRETHFGEVKNKIVISLALTQECETRIGMNFPLESLYLDH